ncbi:hypothetical protein COHA_004987 [Chlorella ohadii]|uniref:Menin n=1 Tax=Chlorella ohadii TaxID=2649997 RepID=A0AAD5H239_9CHLO|nr:hypothetical protein COHA_004987 [Chlorella ohadii]
MEDANREPCLAYLEALLEKELAADAGSSSVERLSIALGVVELALTPRDQSKAAWPADLPATVEALAAAFDAFVAGLASSPALVGAAAAAAKVKVVADAVWSKLQKGYSKDLQHAQHVFNFAAALNGGVPGVKKQLDCAGVVTTVYSICQALSQRYPQHADLAAVRMQVSEDHCWLQLGAGQRETTIEVTTDTAAKRGLPVAPDAWRGWLYTGGHAVLCSPHQALAALVTSINPSVTGGKKGVDSEELQLAQKRMLEALLRRQPGALYPAALCALADLQEVWSQDELDAARDRGDAAAVAALLRRAPGDAQYLFERAIHLAAEASSSSGSSSVAAGGELAAAVAAPKQQANGSSQQAAADGTPAQPANGSSLPAAVDSENGGAANCSGGGARQWYVYSYISAFLARRAEFLASCAEAGLAADAGEQQQQQQPAGQLEEQVQQPHNDMQPAGQLEGQQPAAEQQQQAQQAGEQHPYRQQAMATYAQALQWAAKGGAVLSSYRFQPATDEQLFKDVEGMLDEVFKDGLTALAKRQPGGQLHQLHLFAALLRLWDGVCGLYAGKAKPQAWVALLLRLAKLFSPEARSTGADSVAAELASGPMQRVQRLWRDLAPLATIRQQFETADVEGGSTEGGSAPGERAAKRQRA